MNTHKQTELSRPIEISSSLLGLHFLGLEPHPPRVEEGAPINNKQAAKYRHRPRV